MLGKPCYKCNTILTLDNTYRYKSQQPKLCKDCEKSLSRERGNQNKEERKLRSKLWRENNRERYLQLQKDYAAKQKLNNKIYTCINCNTQFHMCKHQLNCILCENCFFSVLRTIQLNKNDIPLRRHHLYSPKHRTDLLHRGIIRKILPNLPSFFNIHHIDINSNNNRLDNLLLIKNKYHIELHYILKLCKLLYNLLTSKHTLDLIEEQQLYFIYYNINYYDLYIKIYKLYDNFDDHIKYITKTYVASIKDKFICFRGDQLLYLRTTYPWLQPDYLMFMINSGYSSTIDNFKTIINNHSNI